MVGKYLIESGEAKAIFNCHPHQLKEKIQIHFKIKQGSFSLQSYDEDFKTWADVTDMENLPSKCTLKLITGK